MPENATDLLTAISTTHYLQLGPDPTSTSVWILSIWSRDPNAPIHSFGSPQVDTFHGALVDVLERGLAVAELRNLQQ